MKVEPVTGERYRVGRRVEARESGELVAARDLDLGRDVVIKRLRNASSPRAVARFLREARIQGRLEHPAIPPVHEIGYDDVGRPYYATQKLTGITLDAVLADPAPGYSRRALLHAFVDVCFAIETAHSQGVIHRNLEPAKILLGDLGQVYVRDWGLARVATDRDDLDVVEVDVCGEIDVEDIETKVTPVQIDGPRTRKTIGMLAMAGELGEVDDTEKEPVPVPHHRAALAFGTPPHALAKVDRLGSEPSLRTFAHTVSREALKSIEPPARFARGSIPPPGISSELIARAGAKGFVAPEQARGERCLDGRADVFSLGCILRQILGTRDVPPELVELERRATRTDRESRLDSARELGDGVQRYLDGDRDHEQRGTAARAHLAKAHAAQLGGDTKAAIREAGRALAIDPTLTGAADLLGRLVVEPPRQLPAAVAAELEKQDRAETKRTGAKLIAWSLALLALGAALVLLGVRDDLYVPAALSLGVAGVLCGIVVKRTGRYVAWLGLVYALQIALCARAVSPLVAAPLVVALDLAAWPRRPWSWLAAMAALCAVGACEVLVGPTIWFDAHQLVLRSPIEGLAQLPLVPVLAATTALALVTCALVARGLARSYRQQRQRLHLTVWQLRQLAAKD